VKDQPQKPFEPTESHVDSDVYRESWSFNGEVCITGLVPPIAGGARLAHCLVWLLRSFASRSRTIYNGTGALGFTYSGSRTATTLSWALSLGFDLALQDPQLIRRHVLSRGGEPSACRWPRLWLEGSTYDYILPGVPLPRGNAVKNKLVVLAEERQVFVAARAGGIREDILRKWKEGLEVLAGVDTEATPRLSENEEGSLVNMFVLVHQQPAGRVRPRPSLEESYSRHQDLIAALAPSADAKELPIKWHALWRLPSGMKWKDLAGDSWMRYPAVSFALGIRRLQPSPVAGVAGINVAEKDPGIGTLRL
jgi:hypothetical protein